MMSHDLFGMDNSGHRTHRWFLLFADAPVHVRPDGFIGPDEPKHGRLDVQGMEVSDGSGG